MFPLLCTTKLILTYLKPLEFGLFSKVVVRFVTDILRTSLLKLTSEKLLLDRLTITRWATYCENAINTQNNAQKNTVQNHISHKLAASDDLTTLFRIPENREFFFSLEQFFLSLTEFFQCGRFFCESFLLCIQF